MLSILSQELSNISAIPQFPDKRPLQLSDKPLFDKIFKIKVPEISAYTFTNLFGWSEPYDIEISCAEDCVIVIYNSAEKPIILEPLGENIRAAVDYICNHCNCESMNFKYFHASTAELFKDIPGFNLEYDRDNADYLYNAKDLIELGGRKFDAKRNFINRMNLNHNWVYEKMSSDIAEECKDFVDVWCEARTCQIDESLMREKVAIHAMLEHFDALGIVGGAIRIDNKIVAISLGEKLNPETYVFHVEKAEPGIDGLYQLINNQICIHEASDVTYVNREQDLGIKGLRKAKESYQPIKLVDTYKLKVINP